MMTAQIEDYIEVLPELRVVYPEHWAELALDRDRPEAALAPSWTRYEALHASGELMVMTLREEGRLAGYFLSTIGPGLHYSKCLTAHLDIYYVLPAYRGRHGGKRLFKAVKAELIRRGVHRWFVGSKLHKDSSRLFRALGFVPVEIYHSMWLGDHSSP